MRPLARSRAGPHRGRRRPAGPFGLAPDRDIALPAEALAADADAVAHRLAVALDEIQEFLVRVDDDGAGLLAGVVAHALALVLVRNGGAGSGGLRAEIVAALEQHLEEVLGVRGAAGCERDRSGEERGCQGAFEIHGVPHKSIALSGADSEQTYDRIAVFPRQPSCESRGRDCERDHRACILDIAD
ncbi:MAG: hypothetical protein ABS35_26575 [Kaistia sp. SCN 65-12]|nr:MAG: hypothetical protein ABS35_26575 [Kaistia sp. SCN 65-12]